MVDVYVGLPPVEQELFAAAVEKGDAKRVEKLIAGGVDVATRAEYGHTPLLVAAEKGDEAIFELLVAAGADMHAYRLPDRQLDSVLQNAARGAGLQRPNRCRRILADGPESQGSKDSALYIAAGQGAVEIAAVLIDAGAQVDRDGLCPLLCAIKANNSKMVELLIGAGVNLDVRVPRIYFLPDPQFAIEQRPGAGDRSRLR